ncbi:unnamed protein product [Brachionus calyciflorus]|uniref:Peroxiredoxin-5, mitochondrial n=1 Tax=Brachionus calyciflorus TaxID=104777 RepID=A0A813W0M8_9BILA|nr:unnamed protein product [Brachionus calyciflorus]
MELEGQTLPDIEVYEGSPDRKIKMHQIFSGRKGVLLGFEGAFTPVCSTNHITGFMQNFDQLKSKGYDVVAGVTVNDAFVVDAWTKECNCQGKVRLLADPDAWFVKAIKMEKQVPELGGIRSKRFTMLIDNNVIKKVFMQKNGDNSPTFYENVCKSFTPPFLNSTPLEDYVNNNDDLNVVSSTILESQDTGTLTIHKVKFTSLKWFDGTSYNNVPILFPMTKAVKRCMDMVVKELRANGIQFSERFIVSGASKRGWTAYLTAAVDPRVFAVVPIVFDLININVNFHAQFRSLGGKYSFALKDYYNYELSKKIDTVEANELLKLVDVNMYLQNLRDKTIYMIVATGDEFMMPENLQHFIGNLKIQTNNSVYIRVLDSNHYLTGQENSLMLSIKGFLFLLSLGPTFFPKFDWKFSNSLTLGKIDGKISNLEAFESYEFVSYSARTANKKRIDFRKNTLNGPQQIKWMRNNLVKSSRITKRSLSRSVSVKISKSNYVGFYLETRLKFKGEQEYFVFSTNINIAPDTYPIKDCKGFACEGQII